MIFGPEYPKIQTAFKRDERNVIIPGDYATEEIAYLADEKWAWTEKIDGTNIRLHWNGEVVTIGGRTDNASIPSFLVGALQKHCDPSIWKALFAGSEDVTLYGEGYGAKIQKGGGNYRQDQGLIVFDVRVEDWWLKPDDVGEICAGLGLHMVPYIGVCSLTEAVASLSGGEIASVFPGVNIDGMVGRPVVDLYGRGRNRIVTKLKVKDFADLEKRKLVASAA